MIILHASAIGNTLSVWAETNSSEAHAAPKRSGKTAKSGLQQLPFAARRDELSAALASPGLELALERHAFGPMALWIPTTGTGAPVPSSLLIAEVPEQRDPVAVAAWRVDVADFADAQSAALLTACIGRESLAPGVFIGSSLQYWTAAFRFAAALVARQQYLPTLVDVGTWLAKWDPVFTGDDSQRLARLAAAMPSACRAIELEGDPAPECDPVALLRGIVASLVDHLVRTAPVPPAAALPPQERRRKTPAADAWIAALRDENPEVQADDDDLARLAKELKEWSRAIAFFSEAPVRLCIRLNEPQVDLQPDGTENTNAPWLVEFLLQSVADPSLQVSALDVWRGKSAALAAKPGFQSRQFLLMGLGHAAQLWPKIDDSLRGAEPVGLTIDSAEAFSFLVNYAPALEQAGFPVMLPGWWTKRGTRLRLTSRGRAKAPKMQAEGKLSMQSIVEFDYEIAMGDEPMSRKQLEELAKQKSSLVRVRGQWVQVDQAEIRAAIEYLKRKGTQAMTLADVMRMTLGGAEEGAAGLPFDGVAADGWVADFLAQLSGENAFAEQPIPAGLNATLRPYQHRGYSWMEFLAQWGLGACLADDMGLGKTVQVLALIRRRWETDSVRQPTLVVCPTSVIGNWQREAERFVPGIPVMVHHGSDRVKSGDFATDAAMHGIVLTSFSLLHRDIDDINGVGWGAVVLDEAQNIKNPETKQSKAARSLKASTRVALTGTPVENHVGDLWSIMEYLNPGLLGTQSDFKRRYFNPIQAGTGTEELARLKKLTTPFILRRMKTDKSIIADLPDKIEMPVYCTLTKEQASLYQAVVQDAEDALTEAEGIQRRGLVLATLSKLKQVCNHPAQFLHDHSAVPGRSGKLARLTEMLEEALDVGDKALIFSQFQEMGDIVQRHLQESFGHEVLFLHGGTDKLKRDQMVQRFQATDGPKLFVLSLKAGGVGLNLTAANHVFHYDRWWNPAVENQATDRAFRIGQKKTVQVHKFLCAGTLEEKIDEMIQAKQKVADQIVGAGEEWLTELTTDQLKELFALRPEAVE